MAYLVDTNIIIEHSKGIKATIDVLRKLKKKNDLFCSVISLTEFRVGLKDNIHQQMEKVKRAYFPLDVTSRIAELAGAYLQKYHSRYQNFDISDALIAATSVIKRLTLLTRNIKHFPMAEIRIAKECKNLV